MVLEALSDRVSQNCVCGCNTRIYILGCRRFYAGVDEGADVEVSAQSVKNVRGYSARRPAARPRDLRAT